MTRTLHLIPQSKCPDLVAPFSTFFDPHVLEINVHILAGCQDVSRCRHVLAMPSFRFSPAVKITVVLCLAIASLPQHCARLCLAAAILCQVVPCYASLLSRSMAYTTYRNVPKCSTNVAQSSTCILFTFCHVSATY